MRKSILLTGGAGFHRVARRLLSRGEVPHLQGILTRLHDKNMAPVRDVVALT